jgi:uncharacterized protein (TIGR00297 family)
VLEVDWGLRLTVGAAAAGVVAVTGYRHRALSRSGAIAATVTGGSVVGGGGWWWGATLVAFFVTSSALSRLSRNRGEAITVRGSRRDVVQVLANGGVATMLAASQPFVSTSDRPLVFAAFAGSLAAVTADTWATEIGSRSRGRPRSIVSGRPVAPGTSGGVTPLGSVGALAGALLIGGVAWLGTALGWAPGAAWLLPATLLSGVAGAFADSLLGATVQASYRCPTCEQLTERAIHRCGSPTRPVSGFRWITNDVVNLAAALLGAVVGAGLTAIGG